ncbi:hypothetical protein HY988_00375 [Candidatus Micrarchaeota archaeon]|nr:hypothetical protein [Candidatus Micrarchaeota archaeon]
MNKRTNLSTTRSDSPVEPRGLFGIPLSTDRHSNRLFASLATITILSAGAGLLGECSKPRTPQTPMTIRAPNNTTDMPRSNYGWVKPLVDTLDSHAKQSDQIGQ